MPIMVNRRAPLGLPEIAALYAREGATPDEAASNIHLNYPMEAKSVLADRWRATGIPTSPERFFATIANQRNVNPLAQRPTFTNEMERNVAIASGAYDPSFSSPLQKASYAALKQMEGDDRAAIRAEADKAAPVTLETPNDLLRSQLAGDTIGFAKKFLIKRTGMLPSEYYAALPEARGDLAPYTPPSGYGALEGSALPNRLDRNIYDDADFQRALKENPEEAAYAYYRLTGRQLAGDIGEQLASRKRQLDTGREFAEQAIKSGASRDNVSGKWSVWNMAEAEQGGLGLTPGRPSRQLVPATPEQQAWLDTHYESITGRKMPIFDAGDQSYRGSVENVMRGDKKFAEEVTADEATLGRKLTNEEMRAKASRILKQNEIKSPVAEGGKDFVNWLLETMMPPTDQDILQSLQYLGNKLTPTTFGKPIVP